MELQEIRVFNDIPNASDLTLTGKIYGASYLDNVGAFQIGSGTTALRADGSGLWLGATKWENAPFRVDMDGNLVASSALLGDYVEKVGGEYDSSESGARVSLLPSASVGIEVIDDDGNDVFVAYIDGADIGDVILGNYPGGSGVKWDKSAGKLIVKGQIETLAGSSLDGGYLQNETVPSASIVSLHATKITSQLINAQLASITWAKITDVSIENADIENATIQHAKIASLDLGDVTAGSVGNSRVTDLNWTKLYNVAIVNADIVSLSATKITADTMEAKYISGGTIGGTFKVTNSKYIEFDTSGANPRFRAISGMDSMILLDNGGLYVNGELWAFGDVYFYYKVLIMGDLNVDDIECDQITSDANWWDIADHLHNSTGNVNFEDDCTMNQLWVDGNLSCGGTKPFKIPHPLRERRWLVYTAIESNGVFLDISGEITLQGTRTQVWFPDYHKAVTTGTPQVQLTKSGWFGDICVGEENIDGFTILTESAPPAGAKVYWQARMKRKGYEDNPVEPEMDKVVDTEVYNREIDKAIISNAGLYDSKKVKSAKTRVSKMLKGKPDRAAKLKVRKAGQSRMEAMRNIKQPWKPEWGAKEATL